MKRFLATIALLLVAALAFAQGLVPVPQLTAHVIDRTGTLDAIQLKGLDDKLMAFEQAKGTQIAVLMVATTKPEDDASFANRVGNAWKIGRKGVGDGILVVVAKDDHTVRIEVAKALEGAVPDLAAKQIIDGAIVPKFKQGDFAGGLRDGLDQLIARVNGEALPAPPAKTRTTQDAGTQGFDWGDLAIFLFIAVFVVGRVVRAILGRPLGSLAMGIGVGWLSMLFSSSLVIAVIAAFVAFFFTLLSGFGSTVRRGGWGGGPWIGGGGFGGGGGSWGGGGGGGGWGGSGGGGDFGGGGASGNW